MHLAHWRVMALLPARWITRTAIITLSSCDHHRVRNPKHRMNGIDASTGAMANRLTKFLDIEVRTGRNDLAQPGAPNLMTGN
ncbi:MAG: hypothetical protein A3J35_06455 [Gammaproteobacteria bacterium RIFCSPLOWO2_02_FULL_52_10]|nr:MAG: hypothetical protein A3J35_06455 [Gammaproteobacteria bacterium RIFCSPLOWO2_02_FULL_52_10]